MLLVEKIATDNWRLKRLVRFENGLLYRDLFIFKQISLDEHFRRRQRNSQFPLEGDYFKPTPKMEFYTREDQVSEADFDREYAHYIKISSNDDALKADERFIIFVLSDLDIIDLNEETKQVALDHLNQCSSRTFAELKRDFLAVEKEILDEMRVFVSWKKCLAYEERVRQFPAEKKKHKIIKYETHLERMITKNISLLLALQRNRLARNFKEIKARLN